MLVAAGGRIPGGQGTALDCGRASRRWGGGDEFLAVFEEENLEDRLAYLEEHTETLDDRELSFRLLRHYASSVRHQKYQGLDIVTVKVTR